jgi:hypothetical protein
MLPKGDIISPQLELLLLKKRLAGCREIGTPIYY